jgi:integrase/recombinase XerD
MNETITTTFSVIFHLRIEREKHDLFLIYARITINGKRIEVSSKQMMNSNHWNEKGNSKTQ